MKSGLMRMRLKGFSCWSPAKRDNIIYVMAKYVKLPKLGYNWSIGRTKQSRRRGLFHGKRQNFRERESKHW